MIYQRRYGFSWATTISAGSGHIVRLVGHSYKNWVLYFITLCAIRFAVNDSPVPMSLRARCRPYLFFMLSRTKNRKGTKWHDENKKVKWRKKTQIMNDHAERRQRRRRNCCLDDGNIHRVSNMCFYERFTSINYPTWNWLQTHFRRINIIGIVMPYCKNIRLHEMAGEHLVILFILYM